VAKKQSFLKSLSYAGEYCASLESLFPSGFPGSKQMLRYKKTEKKTVFGAKM
jgi:hypothetical protein